MDTQTQTHTQTHKPKQFQETRHVRATPGLKIFLCMQMIGKVNLSYLIVHPITKVRVIMSIIIVHKYTHTTYVLKYIELVQETFIYVNV